MDPTRTTRTGSNAEANAAADSGGSRSGEGEIKIGICLSGGGIRSASFSLGVCQRLIEAGILSRADYISAVSGGSYLAAAMAISNARAGEDPHLSDPPPWSRGSPEESELRRNLTYLAPGVSGRLWLGANVLYGIVLNLVPLVLAAYLAGRILGLFLDAVYPGVGSGPTDWSSLWGVLVLAGVLAASAVGVVGFRRFLDRSDPPRPAVGARSESIVMWLLLGAGAVLLFGAAVPGIVDLLGHLSWGGVAKLEAVGLGFSLRRLILGISLVVLSLCLGGAAVWLLRRRRLPILRAVFAYLSGAGILVAPFLLGALTGVERPWSNGTDVPLFLGTLATIVVFGLFVHNGRYSMHPFYRERIQAAFASRRTLRHGRVNVEPIPYEESIYLSRIADANAKAPGGRSFPQLIMCAAVAARGSEVPNKSWAASFTFEGECSGNRRLIWAPTTKFEQSRAKGGDDLTLPAMMAISGAAVSPLMGRFTLPAFRFLMAMMNIRLGVWISNPKRRSDLDWPGDHSRWRRTVRSLIRRWREPGALYVLKEGLGLAKARDPYVYVSDGGHWENLGLTELLRQGCTHVIAIDASGDPGLGDVGRAMSVARAELGVDFSLDPRKTLGKDGQPPSSPVAVGSFTYPEGDVVGQIYYCRSVLWRDAPSDLHLFAAEDSRFPNHPTSNQFLSGELFDAYRGLGWAAGKELTKVLKKKVPPPVPDGIEPAWIVGLS
jgi:hypothetical protein